MKSHADLLAENKALRRLAGRLRYRISKLTFEARELEAASAQAELLRKQTAPTTWIQTDLAHQRGLADLAIDALLRRESQGSATAAPAPAAVAISFL